MKYKTTKSLKRIAEKLAAAEAGLLQDSTLEPEFKQAGIAYFVEFEYDSTVVEVARHFEDAGWARDALAFAARASDVRRDEEMVFVFIFSARGRVRETVEKVERILSEHNKKLFKRQATDAMEMGASDEDLKSWLNEAAVEMVHSA